jgi:hypothetical protein
MTQQLPEWLKVGSIIWLSFYAGEVKSILTDGEKVVLEVESPKTIMNNHCNEFILYRPEIQQVNISNIKSVIRSNTTYIAQAQTLVNRVLDLTEKWNKQFVDSGFQTC